jgi:hypothetical protein
MISQLSKVEDKHMCSAIADSPIDKHQFQQLLREHVMQVVFVKANGQTRQMRCTTRSDLLPIAETGHGSTARAPSPAVVAWDLDISQWRSFKPERVVQWQLVND